VPERGTHEATDLQDKGIVTAKPEAETTSFGESNDTEDSKAETDAGNRLGFIPAQTTGLPDADNVPEAIEAPAKRPSSLINRISGLWSNKPSTAEPVSRKEPAISGSKPTASILDLSRSDVVSLESVEPVKANLEISDDELDIPAFLRRQAN
jgi:cell division protein FtsZ